MGYVMMVMRSGPYGPMNGHRQSSLSQALKEAGYTVRTVDRLSDALEELAKPRTSRQEQPSLVIVCEPQTPDACRRSVEALRRATSAPILALLPQATEDEVLAVLDAGADDCQATSIAQVEAISRVRALLRRKEAGLTMLDSWPTRPTRGCPLRGCFAKVVRLLRLHRAEAT